MENINLKDDGSVEGYKTNFFNRLTGDTSEDKVFMKVVGKIYVSFCFDVLGHKCEFCQENKNVFLEFSVGKTIRICKDCNTHISKLFTMMSVND